MQELQSNYFPAFPKVGVDPSLKEFISSFYQLSDSYGRDGEWVDLFEDGATLVMGSNKAEGKEGIATVRRGMWEKVARRRHFVVKAFPAVFDSDDEGHGNDTAEVMLSGRVNYELKTGAVDGVDWAGHMRLRRDAAGGWKFSYYRVYM